FTPNSLKATVIVGMPLVVDPATGTGNSPPAWKLAGCPEVAVRFGSARMVIRPSEARASIVALIGAAAEPKVRPSWLVEVIWPLVVGRLVLNVVFPADLDQFTPSDFNTVRFTSATLTRRLTWFGVATESWLTTLPFASEAIAVANVVALSARPAVETLPLRTSEPSTDSTVTFSPGMSAGSDSRRRDTSCSTRIGA